MISLYFPGTKTGEGIDISIQDYDSMHYRQYTLKAEVDKAIHTLEGLVQGIAIDGRINSSEISEFENWFKVNYHLLNRQPFYEMASLLEEALLDRVISDEEKADILWLFSQYSANSIFYDLVTNDVQRLHGIMHGILADNKIELREIQMLDEWLAEHEHLVGTYPYDELCSLLTVVLRDGIISPEETKILKAFFSDFIDTPSGNHLFDDALIFIIF